MKMIAVTGTPGTGKTATARKVAKKLDFYYLDVNEIIIKNKLYQGYDKKRKTKIVDVDKLNKKLIEYIDFLKKKNNVGMRLMPSAINTKTLTNLNIKKIKGIIIDSHLSHYLPKKYVDICIATKCDIKELNRRLKKKKFNTEKIRENLQAEIFDICYNEAIERKHNVIVVDTTKGFNMEKILKLLGD